MIMKVIFVAALVVMATALPRRSRERYDRSYEEDNSDSYEFRYRVQDDSGSDELNFGHTEKRDGDETSGYYYVLLPDTRLQKVHYYVDGDSGFVARVTYSGEAEFDSEEDEDSYERRKYRG